jgi:hypothetical protein
MRTVTLRGVVVLAVVVLGALLGSLMNGSEATVRPVRIDEEPPEARASVTDDAQVLDAYVQRITSPAQGDTIELVPSAEIASRCGDGDGCAVRLVGSPPSFPAYVVAGRWFSTSPTGGWRVSDPEGTPLGSGSTTDSTLGTVVGTNLFDASCKLREALPLGTAGAFELYVVRHSPGEEIDCLLRIDD